MGKILIQEDCTICWHCLLVLPKLLIMSIKSHYISMKERQMLQIKSKLISSNWFSDKSLFK